MGQARGLRVVVALAVASVVASGCSSGSGSKSSAFASYWADGDELCAQQADCSGTDEATCLAAWPTAAETSEAIADADIPDDNIADCDAAVRLLDQCALGSTCEELTDGTSCSPQQTAFQTECALVLAATNAYYMTHPKSIFVGAFHGSYDGSASGTFTGSVRGDGKITTSLVTSTGTVMATGSVFISGRVTLSASVDGVPLNLEGTLSGMTHAFTGTGTWTSGPDTGSWTLTSD